MERLTKRIDLGNGECTVDFSNERCGEFLTNHKAGVRALFERLADYEDAEEQGLLTRLPCKVGDLVYRINPYAKEPIGPMRVSKVVFAKSYSGYSNIEIYAIDVDDSGQYAFYNREINKSVFLTREEAEKALERMG